MADGGRDGTLRTNGLASCSYANQWNANPCEPMEVTSDDVGSIQQQVFSSQVSRDQGHVIDISEGCNVNDAVSGFNNDDDFGQRHYSEPRRSPRYMAVKGDRLKTFHTWPAQMTQKPEKLAEAGLYYTGNGDKVSCFHCDVVLDKWDPEDDPFVEHARGSPDCGNIQLVKGEEFVRKNVYHHVMQTPAVQAVLDCGTSKKSVQKALDAMKVEDGRDVVIPAENILNTALDIEEAKNGTGRHMYGVDVSEEVSKLRTENEDLRNKKECRICMDPHREVIFFPCMHFVCCASCGASVKDCPICRERITRKEKIYMS